ncbi:biosynthetic peptidoglycan transglycosylase [Chitinophaga rhizophila]|uniref:Transglycosylase domain-containing protein n=1 Tax=Chitinophaga rhizophila TaxID=2866212 RepID=A0ABS7G652_9BACT|nr:biosynthetic peptidoglycan transglycosylase [Chitinophaga rhizophila]MBW8683141.1 transglycosylase domain-containing protein [Chitinophaga rhizophila]
MKPRPSLFFVFRQLFIILFADVFPRSRSSAANQACAAKKLGEAFHINLQIDKLTWRLNGRFTVNQLRVQRNDKLVVIADTVSGKVHLPALFTRKGLLRSFAAEEVQIAILSPNQPPIDNNTQAKQPVFPLQIWHYQMMFRLFNRLQQHLPLLTEIKAFTIKNGRHTCMFKDLAMGKSGGELYFSAKEAQLPGLSVNSDNMQLQLTKITGHTMSVALQLKQGNIRSHILSSKDIGIDELSFSGECTLSDKVFELVKTAEARYNLLQFSLFASHDFTSKKYEAGIQLEETSIADFLKTFPDFSYRKIYELSFNGTVAYAKIHFTCNTDNIWEHTFQLDMSGNQLKLKEHPADWHSLHERPANVSEHYMDVRQIQPLLLATILCTEDTTFFKHRGLDPVAIGYSLIQNIINRSFQRGASTITMQLVRNMFLNHEKTVYRKIEEVFIALLLEHFFKVPKMRMLEHYLNIIEMGPGINSLTSASWFYFSKSVNELSLTECLVLSYIIPRPKFFLEAFQQESLQLKRNLHTHIKRFGRVLFLQGIATQEQYDSLDMNITIQGKTLSLLQTAGA